MDWWSPSEVLGTGWPHPSLSTCRTGSWEQRSWKVSGGRGRVGPLSLSFPPPPC